MPGGRPHRRACATLLRMPCRLSNWGPTDAARAVSLARVNWAHCIANPPRAGARRHWVAFCVSLPGLGHVRVRAPAAAQLRSLAATVNAPAAVPIDTCGPLPPRSLVINGAELLGVTPAQALEAYGKYFVKVLH